VLIRRRCYSKCGEKFCLTCGSPWQPHMCAGRMGGTIQIMAQEILRIRYHSEEIDLRRLLDSAVNKIKRDTR
jgi:hypothetical protein